MMRSLAEKLFRVFATILVVVVGPRLGAAQPPAGRCGCTPSPLIKPAPGDGSSYRMRDDRCEGVSLRDVAAPSAGVVLSFTESFEDFDVRSARMLRLEWTSPGGRGTRLTAFGQGPLSSYRMDTECADGVTSYRWPTDVLAALRLSKRDIGLLASLSYRIGSDDRLVLVPLRVSPRDVASRSRAYNLVVLPSAEVQEVGFRITPLDARGVRRSSGPYQKLDRSYFPSMFPIVVTIPKPATAGFYLAEVGLVRPGRGSYLLPVTFYSSGTP